MADPITTKPTRALAEFASGLTFGDLPREVVEHVKLCILDTVGCGVFGATLPWTEILETTLADIDGDRRCSLLGSAGRLGPAHAALVNGSAIHGFELDDLHPRSIVHPGSVVLPAVLAAAEIHGSADGRDIVTAVVVGYEVAARVGMSVGAAHLLQGWHPTGTHGTLGAAAGAGSLLGLTADQMVDAIGIAGTQSAGLMSAQYASMVKRFHAGRAAQSGLYGAVLARNGYTGIATLFEAEYGGYGPTFSPQFDPSQLTAGLGVVWETLAVGFKPYSTNGSCHPTIDALLDLRSQHGITLDDVTSVTLRVSSATKEHVGWRYEPDTVTTAQMNLPYIAAVVLAEGDAFAAQFTEDRIRDPRLVEFSHRVVVEVDPSIDAEGDLGRHHTYLEVALASGAVLRDERRFARGSARQPMTSADVREKFVKLTASALEDGVRRDLETVIMRLDKVDAVDELVSLCVPTAASGVDR